MTLTELQQVVALYHQKDTTDLTQNGLDVFLLTANNVRRRAELLHNFEYSRTRGTLDIDGVTGGDLKDVVFTEPRCGFRGVKEVVAVLTTRADGTLVPLDFTRSDVPIERERYELELTDNLWPVERYPSDAQLETRLGQMTIIQRRTKLFRYPSIPAMAGDVFTATLECICFLPDYTTDNYDDDSPSDFFLEFGEDWMKWAIIYQLNPMFSTFVARQEGNVGNNPKEILSYREDAWRDFVLWDSYMVDSNSTRSR